MADIWGDLAVAVACRIEFEGRCDRLGFVDEFTAVRFAAEFLDSHRKGKVRTDEPHPDMKGKFIDLVRETPGGKLLNLGLEAKWLRPTEGVREWLKELAVDLFRLQHFRTGTAQGTHRILLVAGTNQLIDTELFKRTVQTGSKRQPGLPFILPVGESATFSTFSIRDGAKESRKWLRACHEKLDANLPVKYDARLAGQHPAAGRDDSIRVLVWVTRRRQNWRSFVPDKEWGPA